jgi:hypothetical protein
LRNTRRMEATKALRKLEWLYKYYSFNSIHLLPTLLIASSYASQF